MKKIYSVDNDFINTRLDRWFKKIISPVPQSFIEKNIRKGNIKVNNKKNKSSYKLQKKDLISVYNFNFKINKNIKDAVEYKATKKELSSASSMIIENNDNFVVINKPSGISVQSGTKSRRNILDILRKTNEFKDSLPYPVHRIDKETSGLLIVAKNRKYAQLFTSLFRIRKIHKIYLCIVVGKLKKDKGTLIDELIYYEGKKKILSKAITHYKVLDTNNNYSLLNLIPETGRKHQLRKQLLIHGCPVLGDNKYRISLDKSKKHKALMLHAYKIHFSINNVRFNFLANPNTVFMNFLKEKYLKTSFQ